ncbi:MAG: hypothetical protein ABSE89_04425 [Sedimentisphaerales bacterium]
MWKIINSPIVITIIAIAALFILRATTKPKLASEIRGAYTELNAIIEDGGSDAEKNKAIQKFAQEIATQIREGFSEGFRSNNPQKDDKDKVYLATKQKINISDIKFVKTDSPTNEKVVFVLKNNSDKFINNLKLNYEYYKQGKLIDCKNDWAYEIKIFEPNQEIALGNQRILAQEEPNNYRSDEVKINITSFDTVQME